MVYVESVDTFMRTEDLMAMCHLDYALKTTGGDLRDAALGVAGLASGERLHVVGHGGEGMLANMDIDLLVATLKKGIAKDLSCSILLTPCYAGASSGGSEVDKQGNKVGSVQAYNSVLKQIAKQMRGWSQLTLYGYRGPTITNANMKPQIGYVPAANVPTAGSLQGGLMQKYFMLFKKFDSASQNLANQVAPIGVQQCTQAVGKFAVDAKDFYQEFYNILDARGLLADGERELSTVDILM
jgi:hypothetical protein